MVHGRRCRQSSCERTKHEIDNTSPPHMKREAQSPPQPNTRPDDEPRTTTRTNERTMRGDHTHHHDQQVLCDVLGVVEPPGVKIGADAQHHRRPVPWGTSRPDHSQDVLLKRFSDASSAKEKKQAGTGRDMKDQATYVDQPPLGGLEQPAYPNASGSGAQ